jgi:ABC-type transport system involved in multi-copper enzyme maturation permease subunit
MYSLSSKTGALWLAFFSVIISGNFSSTTFVAERMNGSLEILLTSGVSRQSILSGKIAFIVIMSTVMGILCYFFALGVRSVKGDQISILLKIVPVWGVIILYMTACFLNASCGAWLSVRINSPRLLPFVNLVVLGIIVVVHELLSYKISLSLWSLSCVLTVVGALFYMLALKDFRGEGVIQPLVY